jgi:DNA-binding beta-propeller fold protein YncE
LRELEHQYPDAIVVIGVHSGKFIAERVTARIREAANRLRVPHPIVNDRQFRIWRSFAVRAWPTLVAIDPAGYVVGMHAGEFTSEMLHDFLDAQIARASSAGALDRARREWPLDGPAIAPDPLRYPGKIAIDGDRIAISDSGNDRVLVGTLSSDGTSARISRTVGALAPASHPQGLAFGDETLYVADAGHHSVRAIDLTTGVARTLAGTGRQMRTRGDLRDGALSSPWDLALDGDRLFVAMAGVHRLWVIDLVSGAARPFSGSGAEDIADGPHAEAALAQPMGLALDGERGDGLYFADAESSAVRAASRAPGGGVSTLVGTGLFDFGDRDGVGDAVRLEHPQGIARHEDGRVLIADSYNDSLRWLDPSTREVTTWVRGLHEPGGLAIVRGRAYVADTNAHRIAVVDLATGEVSTLELVGAEPAAAEGSSLT